MQNRPRSLARTSHQRSATGILCWNGWSTPARRLVPAQRLGRHAQGVQALGTGPSVASQVRRPKPFLSGAARSGRCCPRLQPRTTWTSALRRCDTRYRRWRREDRSRDPSAALESRQAPGALVPARPTLFFRVESIRAEPPGAPVCRPGQLCRRSKWRKRRSRGPRSDPSSLLQGHGFRVRVAGLP